MKRWLWCVPCPDASSHRRFSASLSADAAAAGAAAAAAGALLSFEAAAAVALALVLDRCLRRSARARRTVGTYHHPYNVNTTATRRKLGCKLTRELTGRSSCRCATSFIAPKY